VKHINTGRTISWRIAIILVAALAIAGCTTTAKLNRVEIRLLPGNQVAMAGKVVPLASVPAALKRAGATPQTAIVVQAPATLPPAEFKRLSGILASRGFRKVMFTRPRKTDSAVQRGWWQK